jgi:hypothetical protein
LSVLSFNNGVQTPGLIKWLSSALTNRPTCYSNLINQTLSADGTFLIKPLGCTCYFLIESNANKLRIYKAHKDHENLLFNSCKMF